jgi:SAM-dependent methyltransferase
MNNSESTGCPLCGAANSEKILDLRCATIDGSTLYKNISVYTCSNCGHVYNQLSNLDRQGLIRYYQAEYAPTNLTASHNRNNQPPEKQQFSTPWYEQLYGRMKPFVNTQDKVLEVGCATGDFLKYLHHQGFDNLFGIDIAPLFIKHADKDIPFDLRAGSAEQIPFDDHLFDCLVMDQVLEHVPDPRQAFKEARRVVRPGGTLCIALPDAGRYNEHYFFDFYWFLLREHVQHFDLIHLEWLAGSEGFELVCHERNDAPMVNENMMLPNLTAIFKLTQGSQTPSLTDQYFGLLKTMDEYLETEHGRLQRRQEQIKPIRRSQRPVYIWGIGREFFLLYEQLRLRECRIGGLIDANTHKQVTVRVDGQAISAPDTIRQAEADAVLLVTAVAHKQAIINQAKEMGFTGQVVSF